MLVQFVPDDSNYRQEVWVGAKMSDGTATKTRAVRVQERLFVRGLLLCKYALESLLE